MGFFKNLASNLKRSLQSVSTLLSKSSNHPSHEAQIVAIEKKLLASDLGTHLTALILKEFKEKIKVETSTPYESMKAVILSHLKGNEADWLPADQPTVIMFVGVNGVGKTTNLAKCGHFFQKKNFEVCFAAADTFRSGAVEQLVHWGERLKIPVIHNLQTQDPSSVVYDALLSCEAKKKNLLLVDTAGRMQQANLALELKKMAQVVKKINPNIPCEIWMVADAHLGQHTLQQAAWFDETVGLTGFILSKMDGTAQGGVVLPLYEQFKRPIHFIGTGESIEDIERFEKKHFAEYCVRSWI